MSLVNTSASVNSSSTLYWLIQGHMTSNKQTVSHQTSISGQHFLTAEGNSALLPASAHDQTMTKGDMIMMRSMFTSSARCIFQTVFFSHNEESHNYNKSPVADLSGNSEFCFP